MKRFLSKGIFKDQRSGLNSLEWLGVASAILLIVIIVLMLIY